MADVNANIGVQIDASNALAQLKALQKQISSFHTSVAKSSAAAAMAQKSLQTNLINSVNATGKFAAGMRTIRSSAEQFTHALEKNKLSMREYMRYSAASTKTFGRFFKSEFETLNKVARERVKTLQTQYIKMGRDANGALKAIAVRPLALDMDNLATRTQIAAQKQAVLNQLLKQGSTNLLNFGKNTQWAGRQLMVGFTVPLVYLGSMASKVFMDLEKEAIRFKRVYGEMFTTPEETQKMTDEILNLADTFTKYGVAVKDTMKMAADAAATGKMGADLIAQVTEATRLAVLGYVEQEEALKTVISLTDAFAIASEDLAKKTNFLNAVENQTILSIEDLTIAIPKAGPVVKQLGGSVEDLAFFMTAMKEGGINASEGANALKSGLASLINPTDKAAKMLEGMGININDIVEKNKGDLKKTVLDFAFALDSLKPLERSRAIEQLFGKFQFARLSTLFKNVIAQGTQSERVLQLTAATAEELAILSERELKTTEESTMYKFRKAVEDLKKSLVPLGEAFLKAVTPVVDFFKRVFDRFNELSDGTKTFVVGITALVAGIGPVALMTFGLLANGIANIIKLGIVLRNGYLKLTGRSNDAATATQYLTTEQLEAAAIANSLQQSHQNLTNQFTVERDAVLKLRDAYQQAATAAANFAKANPGMMRPGFVPGKPGKVGKFSQGKKSGDTGGVLTVPGPKGAGDVVPAMVAPEETIISAENSKKYSGLIEAIRTDSVPGYARSKRSSQAGGRQMIQSTKAMVAGHLGGPMTINVSQELAKVNADKGLYTDAYIAELKRLKASGQKTVEVYTNNIALMSSALNEAMKNGTATIGQVKKEIGKSSAHPELKRQLQLLGISDDEIEKQISIYVKNLNAQLDTAKKQFGNKPLSRVQMDKVLADATKSAGAQTFGTGNTKQAKMFKSFISTPTTFNEPASSQANKQSASRRAIYSPEATSAKKSYTSLRGQYGISAGTSFAKKDLAVFGIADKEIDKFKAKFKELDLVKQKAIFATKGDIKKAAPLFKEYGLVSAKSYKDGMKTLNNEANDAAMQSRSKKRRSPHPIMAMDARDDAKSYNQTRQAEAARLAKFQQNFTTNYGNTGQPTAIEKSERRQIEKLMKRQKALQSQANKEQERINREKMKQYGHTGAITDEERTQRRLAKSQTNALNKAAGAVRKKAAIEEAQAREAEKTRQLQQQENNERRSLFRSLFRRRLTEDKNAAAAASGGMQGKLMGASMIASTGLMMASMAGGQIGETAQKLMMPMMALTMLLPMLSSPWGALIVATLAVGGLLWKFNKDIENARKEGINLAKAMSMTTDKIISLSKVTGTVSATELANRQRVNLVSGTTEAQRRSGQTILQSDFGKQILSDISTQQKAGFSAEEISKNIANNLTQAIMQGVVTTEQAKSIASALGEKLGNYEIPAMISGNLVQLLGPQGEDLLENPLEIILKIKQDTEIDLQTAFENASREIDPMKIIEKQGRFKNLADILVPFADPFKDTAISSEMAKRDAAAVQLGAEAVAQNQRNVDELNRAYDIKLKTAKTDKEIKAIEDQRKRDLDILASKNKQILDDLKLRASQMGPEFNKAITTAIDAAYKDAPDTVKIPVEIAKEDLETFKSPLIKGTLQIGLASKDLDPSVVSKIVGWAEKNPSISTEIDVFVSKNGLANLNTVTQLLGKTGADEKTANVMLNYINTNPQNLDKDMEALSVLASFKETYGITLNLKTNGRKQLETASKALSAIKTLPQKLDLQLVTKLAGENPEIFGPIKDNWAALSEGKKTIDKNLVVNFSVGKSDPTALAAAQAEFKGKGLNPQTAVATYIAKGFTPPPPTPKTKDTDTKDKDTTPDSSFIDDLTNKLRLFQDSSVKARTGFLSSMKEIQAFLKRNKNKNDLPFKGLSQQLSAMRSRGKIGKQFLDAVVGMSPEEYEKVKKKIFTFDKGLITGLTEYGKVIQRAQKSAAVGEWNASLKEQNNDLNDQKKAFNKLIAAGTPVSKAYELISDAALASAIANTANNKQLKETIALYDQIDKRSQIAEAFKNIRTKIADVIIENDTKKKIESQFSYVYQQAINSDETLKAMIRLGQQGSEEFKKRMQQVLDSLEFKTSIFEDGYGKAQEAFSAEETAINLKFESDNAADKKLISEKENEIAKIQYRIDDWQAELQGIQTQEDAINAKYEEQSKALDTIFELNKDIADQQKTQLSLADALSQGDISAAAKIVADMRAQDAQKAVEDQKKEIQAQKEIDLANIRNAAGLTRTQIEENIKNLEKEIFDIEESLIEPAKERIRLAEYARDIQISNLTVLGKTKLEWEGIKNGIELAKVRSDEYKNAMLAALAVVEDIKRAWASMGSTTPTMTIDDKTTQYDAGKDILNTELSGGNAAKIAEQIKNAGGTVTTPTITNFRSAESATMAAYQKMLEEEAKKSASNRPGFRSAIVAMSSGGFVPKGTDIVPAMLTPGEFIINRTSASKNKALLEAINSGANMSMFGNMSPAMLSAPQYQMVSQSNNVYSTNIKPANVSTNNSSSVYNYSVTVNSSGLNANPNGIARAVIDQIRYIDSQRIRGQ